MRISIPGREECRLTVWPLIAAARVQNDLVSEKRWSVALLAVPVLLAACGTTTTAPPQSRTTSTPRTKVSVATTVPQLTSTTVVSPPTTTPKAAAAPTSQQVAAQIATTHETADPSEGFVGSPPVTVGDGAGGYLTAVSALRHPSADGHGDLVFFWHNQTFLGWDTNKETWNVSIRGGGTNAIEATYPDYAPGEPACCPTLPPVTITYSWNGVGLAQNRTLPAGAIVGIDVTSG